MNRFVKLFVTELRSCALRAFVPAFVFLVIYLMLWLLNSFIVGTLSLPPERWDYFLILTFVFCAMLPSAIYGYVREPGKSVFYLLLPASIIEKYAVMILTGVFFFPAMYVLLQLTLDSVLVLVGGGNWGYVDNLSAQMSGVGRHWFALVFCSSFFIVGNLLFHTHRTVKTFALMMAVFLVWRAAKRILGCMGAEEKMLTDTVTFISVIYLWILGYRLLKTMEMK